MENKNSSAYSLIRVKVILYNNSRLVTIQLIVLIIIIIIIIKIIIIIIIIITDLYSARSDDTEALDAAQED